MANKTIDELRNWMIEARGGKEMIDTKDPTSMRSLLFIICHHLHVDRSNWSPVLTDQEIAALIIDRIEDIRSVLGQTIEGCETQTISLEEAASAMRNSVGCF